MAKGAENLKKKTQRIFAGILAILVSIAMVGSGLLVFFFNDDEQPYGSNGSNQTNTAKAEYDAQKLRIEGLVEKAKQDPGNIPLQKALGNEYYDAGLAAEGVAPTEVDGHYKQAVVAYQNVLKTDKDPSVMVDMATAAFKSGDNDLADKSFKEAIALKPDFYNGLFNYGVFLAYVKQDMSAAIAQWQKAQEIAQTDQEKEHIKLILSQAQSQLKNNEAPAADGLSNPTLKE